MCICVSMYVCICITVVKIGGHECERKLGGEVHEDGKNLRQRGLKCCKYSTNVLHSEKKIGKKPTMTT